MPSLSSKIHAAAKRPNVSAIVIDVLGGVCSVRLSQRGSILRGLSYSGAAPSKGQQVWVDYSRGNPVVVTSSSGGEVPRVQGNGSPIVYASQSGGGGGSPPDIPPQTKQGNVYFRGVYSEEEIYLAYDVVVIPDELYGDAFYLCKQDSIGNAPDNDEYWYLWGGGNPPIIDPGSFVGSVTGLNTDNTDPQNPVVQISVDGETITGAGTPEDPLVGSPGGGTPAGNDREIQFNDDGAFGASEDFKLTDDGTVVIGTPSPHITIPPLAIAQGRSGGSSFHYQFTFGDETLYSRLIGYHARGTLETSAASELNDILMAVVGRGYWAQDSPNPGGAELRIVATENHENGKHGTAFELWVIPNESTTRVKIATIDEEGINLVSGKEYRIDGVPIGDGKHPALQQISAPAAFDTDFRGLSSALPAGWAWAGSPFITPNTIQYNSNHLYFRHTGGTSRVFLYEAVPTVPGGLTHFDYFSYLTGFYNSNGYFQGLRIDDGTDNNYFEFGMQRATTGSPIRWYYYERNGGGSVVSGEFANYAMPFTPAYMWISLSPRQTYYSNWSGRGQLVGDMIFQLTGGGGKTWTPTRIGITQRRTADQWDISYLVGTGISYL